MIQIVMYRYDTVLHVFRNVGFCQGHAGMGVEALRLNLKSHRVRASQYSERHSGKPLLGAFCSEHSARSIEECEELKANNFDRSGRIVGVVPG
jgi:hypothetical protein